MHAFLQLEIPCRWAAILVGLAVATLPSSGNAASPWSMRAWQTENGLPDNNLTGVVQSQEGYLWVASHAGLARFDGLQFDPFGLPGMARTNAMIRALFLGQENTIWAALEVDRGQVVAFNSRTKQTYTTADGIPGFKPLVITQTPDGAVWIGYVDGSVCRVAQRKVTRFTAADGLAGTGGCWLTTDNAGRLWYAKAGQAGFYGGRAFHPQFTIPGRVARMTAAREGGLWIAAGKQLLRYTNGEPAVAGELPTSVTGVEPSALFEDRAGDVWVGTRAGGLFNWNGSRLLQAETSHRDINCIGQDREGNIWVGTDGGGLNRLRNRVIALHGSSADLPLESVRSVCEDSEGSIWATGSNGALARRTRDKWQTLSAAQGWPGSRATAVAADPRGGVWIGTYGAGLAHLQDGRLRTWTRAEGLGGENIRALLVDSRGDLWLGLESTNCVQRLQEGRFTTFLQPRGSRTVRTIAEDSAGRIWLGTSDGFLLRVQDDVLVDEGGLLSSMGKPIRSLYADQEGGLWIGFAGAGLGLLRTNSFLRFSTDFGLPDDSVSAIVPAGPSSLWLGPNRGIFQLSRRELDPQARTGNNPLLLVDFSRNEALPNLQCAYGYWPNTVRTREGVLWFATRSGLAEAEPARAQPNRLPPPVVIQKVVLDGQPLPLTPETRLRIPAAHRRLDIEFTAFNFAAPESLVFRYRLAGWDETWSTPSPDRRARFPRLAAGNYEFQVAARNTAGVWNESGRSVSFEVEPYTWETWWFRVATGAIMVAAVGLVIRARERRNLRLEIAEHERQHAVERERARIARDIHDELGTSLTQIGLLADMGETQPGGMANAGENFARISTRARRALQSLEEIVWAANPRNDCLPRLADYLCQLADETFEDTPTRCRKDVPTGLPSVPVGAELRHNLALAVKEALANSLKHARASQVKLRLEWSPPELTVTVQDDGVGFRASDRRPFGTGLSNQVARLQEIGGQVDVVSTPGYGTVTKFRVLLDATPLPDVAPSRPACNPRQN